MIKKRKHEPKQNQRNQYRKWNGKRLFILGYSIPEHVIGYEIRKKLDNCKVYLNSVPGAKMKCMEDYAQPTIRTNSDVIVIHVGTNDLLLKKESAEISSAIVDVALKLKSGIYQVSISNLTKVLEINQHLTALCHEKNINIIDHGNTNTVRHLNGSKLHLNLKGKNDLTEKFTEVAGEATGGVL